MLQKPSKYNIIFEWMEFPETGLFFDSSIRKIEFHSTISESSMNSFPFTYWSLIRDFSRFDSKNPKICNIIIFQSKVWSFNKTVLWPCNGQKLVWLNLMKCSIWAQGSSSILNHVNDPNVILFLHKIFCDNIFFQLSEWVSFSVVLEIQDLSSKLTSCQVENVISEIALF